VQATPSPVPPPRPAPSRMPAVLATTAPYAGPALIAIVGTVMLARTWRTWPDVLVDFGRELYLPWQIANGRTLYLDLAHFSGPLSQYWNALWFRLFGPGIMTLAFVNIALTAVFVALAYGLLRRMASRLATTAAGHPLRRQRVHHALDHGVPQGGRRLARGARAFLRGEYQPTPGRGVTCRRA